MFADSSEHGLGGSLCSKWGGLSTGGVRPLETILLTMKALRKKRRSDGILKASTPFLTRLSSRGSEVMGRISEVMNTLKRILRTPNAVLLVLFASFFLPVSAQSQASESLTVMAQGHGVITSAAEELKINSALIVLRPNGTVLITATADLLLQADGTWSTSASSPEEILLKVTGGVLKGELTGSGKLLLTSDRKSIKELTINMTSSIGLEISVTFFADDSKAPGEGM